MKKTRKLGNSGLEVSALTLGTWVFAGDKLWGPQEERDSIKTIHAALDQDINFFDSAPGYGDGKAEEILGKALEGCRERAIIATKVSSQNVHQKGIISSCDESLKRLKTDYIDLLQVHWPNYETPFREAAEAFSSLKEAGKIRAIGVCNFGAPDMAEWFDVGGEMVSNQLAYSLLTRSIEYEIIPVCREKNISVLPYSPLMQGLLTGKFRNAEEVPEGRARSRHFSKDRPMSRHDEPGCETETFAAIDEIRKLSKSEGIPMEQLSLAWLMAQDTVGSVIVGARNVKQLEDNIPSLDLRLSGDLITKLNAATESVKSYLGPNPDLWGKESRIRHGKR